MTVYKVDGKALPPDDQKGLAKQLKDVRDWSLKWAWEQHEHTKNPDDWKFFTLEELANGTHRPVNSIPSLQSKLRELRSPIHTAFHMLKRPYLNTRLFEYFLMPHGLEEIGAGLIAKYDVPIRNRKKAVVKILFNEKHDAFENWLVSEPLNFRIRIVGRGTKRQCELLRERMWEAGIGT